jgi:hypothetical protein
MWLTVIAITLVGDTIRFSAEVVNERNGGTSRAPTPEFIWAKCPKLNRDQPKLATWSSVAKDG